MSLDQKSQQMLLISLSLLGVSKADHQSQSHSISVLKSSIHCQVLTTSPGLSFSPPACHLHLHLHLSSFIQHIQYLLSQSESS